MSEETGAKPTCLWCMVQTPAEGTIRRDGNDYYFCRRHIAEFRLPSDTVIEWWIENTESEPAEGRAE